MSVKLICCLTNLMGSSVNCIYLYFHVCIYCKLIWTVAYPYKRARPVRILVLEESKNLCNVLDTIWVDLLVNEVKERHLIP